MSDRTYYTISTEYKQSNDLILEHAEVLRPGQSSPTLLACMFTQSTNTVVWTALKSHFSSARGDLEAAFEYAIKRANETNAQSQEYQWGAILACARDATSFAAAGGGSSAAYMTMQKNVTDISPADTPALRMKPFAALSVGLCPVDAVIVLSIRPQNIKSIAALVYHEENHEIPLDTHGMVLIHTNQIASVRRTIIVSIHAVLTLASAFVHPAIYRSAYVAMLDAGKNPLKTTRLCATRVSNIWKTLYIKSKTLPRKKRVVIMAIVLATAMLLHTTLSALGSRTVEEIIAETLKRERMIVQNIEQNNESHALALLDDTLVLLDKTPERMNDVQKETIGSLRQRLLHTAAAINKLSIIEAPTPVVSLEKSFKEKRVFDLSGLALAQGRLYTVNRAEKEIYELDGKERRIVVMKDFPEGAGNPIGMATTVQGLVMVITENPRGILTLNTNTRQFTFAPLTLPREDAQPVAYAAYHERLYMLDARSRAVYRYELTPKGFDLWSPWSDESTLDFSQATAFAIDGSIYVTFSDHDIVKLTQGKREPFAVASIRPPLESVIAIATKENSPFLYLLDRPQRRAVIIAKENGALVAQYTSPIFTDLRGIFPDETAKRIYLLNGDTVYSIGPDDKSIFDL